MTPRWHRWLGASFLVHTGLVTLGLVTLPRVAPPPAAPSASVEFDFPPPSPAPGADAATETTPLAVPLTTPAPPDEPTPLGGVRSAQNVNAETRGERGDGRSPTAGRLLVERADGVNLSPTVLNTFAADQEQRLRTSRDRTSPQDRRSTPNPGYDPWISSHDGVLLYRVAPARELPAEGAVLSPGAAVAPGASATAPGPVGDAPGPTERLALGALPRPAAGLVHEAPGSATRAAGPSAEGHASIEHGHASTTADFADERPRDNTDAEALASNLLRNALAASVHAGPERAEGVGGVGGGGAAGSGGGQDTGGRARAYGEGEGWLSVSAPDSRYERYFLEVQRRLYPLWADAFPRDEQLRLRQGTVILRFVIESDGRVRNVAVHRRSGIDAFDRNVVAAVAGARMPPIPAELRRRELPLTVPFVFRNPIVR